jgi:molybdate transport system regulatory protein
MDYLYLVFIGWGVTVTFRISVGRGGRGVIGEGRMRLLELIERTGSLRQAALAMGMSYRNAWGTLKHIEEEAGGKMVESKRGGNSGGRTVLTPMARDMMGEYDKAKDRVEQALAGILINAWAVVVIHDGRGSFLVEGGRLPKGRITVDRPTPAAISDILQRHMLRGDRIRGPRVISSPTDGSLNLVFELDPEVRPLKEWRAVSELEEFDQQMVALFYPLEEVPEGESSSEELDE